MYRPSLARSALALLIAAAGSLGLSKHQQQNARAPRGWRNPFKAVASSGGTPHQGPRECARRRGGQDWLGDRNFRRARRGLPALTR